MFAKLKCFVIFVQLLVTLITYRPFGSVIFDVNERYDELDLIELFSLITFLQLIDFLRYPDFLLFFCLLRIFLSVFP